MIIKTGDINLEKDCCGCNGCVQACPMQCISMETAEKGFSYPVVDMGRCIGCGLCERVCPVLNAKRVDIAEPLSVYAAKNPDEEIRMKSSSGGVFTMLAERTIRNGGVVFGARFDENWDVIHDYAETIDGIGKFQGSKYVQSRIDDCFKKAKQFLDTGREVLFSGTPCQIAGLRCFLRKNYVNLCCVEVVCHGVPSPLVFKHYIKSLEKKHGATLISFKFRDKANGWKAYEVVADFANAMQYRSIGSKDPFIRGFIYNLYIRSSCTDCKFKRFTSGADITLGDFWGSERFGQKYNDDKGVSLVCINTNRGLALFESIKSDITELIESTLKDAVEYNLCLVESVKKHPKESRFWRLFRQNDFEMLVKQVLYVSKFKFLLSKKIPYYLSVILHKLKSFIYQK